MTTPTADTSVRKAPELPPWPKKLPPARRTPAEARCVDDEGQDLGQGVWVPQRRSDATEDLIRACRQLPALSQGQLDRTWDTIMPAAIEGAVNAALAESRLREAESEMRDGGYSLSTVLWTGVGGALLSLAVIGVLMLTK